MPWAISRLAAQREQEGSDEQVTAAPGQSGEPEREQKVAGEVRDLVARQHLGDFPHVRLEALVYGRQHQCPAA